MAVSTEFLEQQDEALKARLAELKPQYEEYIALEKRQAHLAKEKKARRGGRRPGTTSRPKGTRADVTASGEPRKKPGPKPGSTRKSAGTAKKDPYAKSQQRRKPAGPKKASTARKSPASPRRKAATPAETPPQSSGDSANE